MLWVEIRTMHVKKKSPDLLKWLKSSHGPNEDVWNLLEGRNKNIIGKQIRKRQTGDKGKVRGSVQIFTV